MVDRQDFPGIWHAPYSQRLEDIERARLSHECVIDAFVNDRFSVPATAAQVSFGLRLTSFTHCPHLDSCRAELTKRARVRAHTSGLREAETRGSQREYTIG